MENESMQIAQTILDQIRYFDRSALMAWGAKNFLALPESKEYHGGLRMNVNGLTFKGIVSVGLTWTDEYIVSFITKTGELQKEFTGVYCDNLVPIIDYIEGKHAA